LNNVYSLEAAISYLFQQHDADLLNYLANPGEKGTIKKISLSALGQDRKSAFCLQSGRNIRNKKKPAG